MLFELRDISFGYPTRPPVLHDASMTLDAGERLCITGANGAGKSTLLSIMVGLAQPSAGTVTAFGTPRLEEADFHEVRDVARVEIQSADDKALTLLFDGGHSLEERLMREQFSP